MTGRSASSPTASPHGVAGDGHHPRRRSRHSRLRRVHPCHVSRSNGGLRDRRIDRVHRLREKRQGGGFHPATDNARKALTAALNHWEAGNSRGRSPARRRSVEVVDTKWKAGQKLKSYEILGESARAGPRTFKVRLTLAKGPPMEMRYMVVGIDPLWVYREEDFQAVGGRYDPVRLPPADRLCRRIRAGLWPLPTERGLRSVRGHRAGGAGGVPERGPAGTRPSRCRTRSRSLVADGLRTKGRTLSRFILGPVPADAPRCFAVQLTLGNPPADMRERYVVVGIDPIWVAVRRLRDDHPLGAPDAPATKK